MAWGQSLPQELLHAAGAAKNEKNCAWKLLNRSLETGPGNLHIWTSDSSLGESLNSRKPPNYFKIISYFNLSFFRLHVLIIAASLLEDSWVHPVILWNYLAGVRLLLWEYHTVCTYSQGNREEGTYWVWGFALTLDGAWHTLLWPSHMGHFHAQWS